MAGGEVKWYSPGRNEPTPRVNPTSPSFPKSAQVFPVAPSTAMRRPSFVATKIRRRHGSPAARVWSSQVETPREVNLSVEGTERSSFGSREVQLPNPFVDRERLCD
jgi:hypothetical protein